MGAGRRSANRNGTATTVTITTPPALYHQPRPASERVAVSMAIQTSTAVSQAMSRKQWVAVVDTWVARLRWPS